MTTEAQQGRGPRSASDATGAIVGPTKAEIALELQAFLASHLEHLARLAGATGGFVYLAGSATRRAGFAAHWADDAAPPQLRNPKTVAAFENLAKQSLANRPHAGVHELRVEGAGQLYGASDSHAVLAVALEADGRREGVTLLVFADLASAEAAAGVVQAASARFEAFLWRQHAMSEGRQRALLRETLELLDAAQQGQDARAMSSLMATELARRFGCSRASIGLIAGGSGRIRLWAVSGSDDLDKKGPAAETLEEAMEECALQDIELLYPAPTGSEDDPASRRVLQAHDRLSQRFGPSAICSFPLRVEGDLVGVVTMERPASDPFPAPAVPLLRLVAEYIGPALWTRRLADRGILAVSRDRVRDFGSVLVGPRYTATKLVCLGLLLVLLFAALVPLPARVAGEATVRAESGRAIVPPYAGVLAEVMAEPGDRVRAGQVLAVMDLSDLRLRRAEISASLRTRQTERDAAEQAGEASKVAQFSATIDQLTARLAMVDRQIEQGSLTSPIDGLVARGELEDYVGATVDPSQPLLEIVGDERVLVLLIDERDGQRLSIGQRGTLTSRARPDEAIAIEVTRISPAVEPQDGQNAVRVEARFVGEAPGWLRPGETGVARLAAGRRTLMQRVLGPLLDELRLRMWW